MSKSMRPEKGYIRTQSDWLRITLVDTMFNKLYFCLKKYFTMSSMGRRLNAFYDPETDIGSAVYNGEYKVKNGVMVLAANWNKALSVRKQLYWDIKYMSINTIPSKCVRQYIVKYLLGIHDIMSQLLIE